jgi:AraC-like DNA-binding protein
MLCNIILEPERLDLHAAPGPLGELLRRGGGVAAEGDDTAAALRRRLRMARDRLAQARAANLEAGTPAEPLPPDDAAFDRQVLGMPLPQPSFDPRIAAALAHMETDLGPDTAGTELAARAGLSLSRFVRLFKAQVGVPLRTYRGWKRARSVLPHVTQPARLIQIALEAGYPDPAHFSRSIRQIFGLQPREVMAGSRRITLLAGPQAPNPRPDADSPGDGDGDGHGDRPSQ